MWSCVSKGIKEVPDHCWFNPAADFHKTLSRRTALTQPSVARADVLRHPGCCIRQRRSEIGFIVEPVQHVHQLGANRVDVLLGHVGRGMAESLRSERAVGALDILAFHLEAR